MRFLTLIFLTIVSASFAQKFEDGTVVYGNGKKVSGLVRVPDAYDKDVAFKTDKKANKQELKSDDLKEILINDKAGEIKFVRYLITYGKKKEKIWVQEQVKGFCSLYTAAEGQTFVRSGDFTSAKTNVHFFLKRQGEGELTPVGTYITGAINVRANTPFRKAAADYFKDAPELVTKINNKEFGLLESNQLVMEYNEKKGKKKK